MRSRPTKPYIALRPYQPGDETAFTPRADFLPGMKRTNWDWSKGPPGRCWTIIGKGDVVLGIGGLKRDERDQGTDNDPMGFWGWSILSEDFPRRGWSTLLWLVARVLERQGHVMFDAWVKADNAGGKLVLSKIGFVETVTQDWSDLGLYTLMRKDP